MREENAVGALGILREHQWFIAIVVLYVLGAHVASRILDAPFGLEPAAYKGLVTLFLPLFLVAAFLVYLVRVVVVDRPSQPLAWIAADLRSNRRLGERTLLALPILVLMPLFASAYTFLKASILVVNPAILDVQLAEWDRFLHGGLDPWLLLQPVLGFPAATSAVNFLYQLWFFVMVAVWLWQAFSLSDRRLRMRFFIAFLASWALLGTVAAMLMPSVGPCYYGRATGIPDPFVPLMDYLRQAAEHYPVWALDVQEGLWSDYQTSRVAAGSGISAMPSMHVSSAYLLALAGWRADRRIGIALWAFAAAILIGSVHLGWHYAIDGYAAIAGTWLIWWGAGRIVDDRRNGESGG